MKNVERELIENIEKELTDINKVIVRLTDAIETLQNNSLKTQENMIKVADYMLAHRKVIKENQLRIEVLENAAKDKV